MAFWFEGMRVYEGNVASIVDKEIYNLHQAISYRREYLPQDYLLVDEHGNDLLIDGDDIGAEHHRTGYDLVTIQFVGLAEEIELVVTNQTVTQMGFASLKYAAHRAESYDIYPWGNEMNPYLPEQEGEGE